MESLDRTAARALRTLLAGQPLSGGKVDFAWRVAAGTSLARAATVAWHDQRLSIHPKSEAWRRELLRARPLILQRLGDLLGPEVITTLVIHRPSPHA